MKNAENLDQTQALSNDLLSCAFQRTVQNLPSLLDSCPQHSAPSDAEDSGSDIDPSQADGDNDPNISNYLPLVDDVAESETLSSGSAKKTNT